ncbi:MAG: hypothetical protein JNM19_09540 [Chitinophagaceae bacterium]|nr:hypothetical protein [Chitinophagaceae bacterium]
MKKHLFIFTAIVIMSFSFVATAHAQQYKLRQTTSVMGMKTESTIYVKGMRKRTETGSMMGMPAPPITIEQCDLQRTIKINDKKKLYFIEPFSKETEEVIDEDIKAVPSKSKPVATKPSQKGGTITMWYNITDTGERKKMYGFNARHVWTSQKMKPSPDACSMKDSIIIKTDGWYIDLPQFNCPIRYRPGKMSMDPNDRPKPECQDRFVTRRSGKGKLGFALIETTTIIMGGKGAQVSEFQTNLETLEFSAAKLDSMLFEIPPGYKLAASEDELQEKFDMGEMMRQAKNEGLGQVKTVITEEKTSGKIRIGVYEPKGEGLQLSELQQHLTNSISVGNIEAVTVSSEEQAKKLNCDYTLTSDFIKIKQGSKVGGLLKAIKNTDPNAASSFNMDISLTLTNLSDGSLKMQPKLSGKYEGKIDEAAKKALDEGSRQIVKGLN